MAETMMWFFLPLAAAGPVPPPCRQYIFCRGRVEMPSKDFCYTLAAMAAAIFAIIFIFFTLNVFACSSATVTAKFCEA
ncbi:MAG: hypothetical protein A2234_08560 [Elusimicrobia bacterium RIFOXYA2_FULL_58_8]|nr:MAG: hypothetical protein A2234_08560 [Elusimicrobia bacterium RIFOXYA2_FULL_58_8]OGS14269.1 MAG: hypothetical protein A2285_05000 [Elusimicrobia bacterium RIFOXYA12_FULL_57_11]